MSNLDIIMISQFHQSAELGLLLSVAALYIVQCPFNKVEESFNTQAIHDIVNLFPNQLPHKDVDNHEIATRTRLPWDHMLNPGVVPRTFIGALIIGLPLKFVKYALSNIYTIDDSLGEYQADFALQFILQICSRFLLASISMISLIAVTRAIHRRFGLAFRLCFLITTISQFHYLYYAGRFLPNTFASILANFAMAAWINRQYGKSVIYIAFTVVIFRFDTALFFGCLLLDAVFIRRILPLGKLLVIGIPSGLIALIATFVVDSMLWARPIWPEFEGLYFNVWLNKSHEWGVQPFLWYIYSCVPRILMSSAPIMMLSEHRVTRDFMIPTLGFIFLYSLLPHKELRFILFITPFLNICAASGLMNIYYYLNKFFLWVKSDKRNRTSYIAGAMFSFIIAGMFLANIFGSYILLRASSHNYPGGQAAISLGMTKDLLEKAQQSLELNSQNKLDDLGSEVGVYINNLAAQTGVSRFVQVDGAYYSKSAKLNESTFKKGYELIYLVLEPKEVSSFLDERCPKSSKDGSASKSTVDLWRTGRSKLDCNLPNQKRMQCAIIDTVYSFQSINLGDLVRRIKGAFYNLDFSKLPVDSKFIRERRALDLIECS